MRPLIRGLMDVQDNLGLQQDGEVARERLASLAADVDLRRYAGTRKAVRALAKRYAQRNARLRSRLGTLLKQTTGTRWERVDRALQRGLDVVGGNR